MAQERNGTLNRWLLGVVASTLLVAAGWGVVGIKDTAEASHAMAWEAKTQVEVLKAEKADILRRLEAIDKKIDQLLEKR